MSNGEKHWNQTVNKHRANVLELFYEADPILFMEYSKQFWEQYDSASELTDKSNLKEEKHIEGDSLQRTFDFIQTLKPVRVSNEGGKEEKGMVVPDQFVNIKYTNF